ncbi:hypothetical protein M3181_03970 [Mesobacillus maritimus]|uniref:hypothetical protein n=1 Tax=Mesobacillus maritimus TaxID=1643336 RepID=UPI00203EFF0F|nr:hypothetical protein [Mesobacillus maritimus]MCM3668158.1 hypothetical protein [Mesobacillus maritimus]
MNDKKRVLLILLLLMIGIGGTGCMNAGNDSNFEERALAYIEDKYDREFEKEWVKVGSDVFANLYGEEKLTVHPKENPEVVFTIQKDGQDFVETYIPAKWASELQTMLEEDISKELPEGAEFKVNLRNTNFNESMSELSVDEFLAENKNVTVSVIIGIKTEGKPDVDQYSQGIYNIYNLVKNLEVKKYVVSVGLVDESEDISDFIRTSYVNNITWSNLDAKVYGEVNVDERLNPDQPSDMIDDSLILHSPANIAENYEAFGE